MFLSKLVVNVGSRSDRLRPGRRWIEQPYRVHQRLCMGFPDPVGKREDPDFLQPFDPARFFDISGAAPEWDARASGLPRGAHVQRAADRGFLFRIDADQLGRPFILVQSGRRPDWEYAFHNASYLLNAPPQIRIDERTFRDGERLCFRLLANPTKKIKRRVPRQLQQGQSSRDNGRRVAYLNKEDQLTWLEKKGTWGGFTVMQHETLTVAPPDIVRAYRTRKREENPFTFVTVRFDGVLVVTHPEIFRATLAAGIGSGKAFGFGLLSVAPAHA